MSRKQYSRYVLVVDNLSSNTPSSDIQYEFEMAGKVLHVTRDYKARAALVEFDRSSDAKYAWDKMDGFKMDGRRWKVDWASRADFELFGWRWTEGRSPSPRRRSRSRSPATPHDKDLKRHNSHSPERARSLSPDQARRGSPSQ
ncbi:hypothetical protein OEZ86_014022 [Tetradesmus obliquus]|uniref:RRM domain-containing protein n=1 Tax=Tetradesmus obliquus TaxID=3088 RepID=A0A383VDF2_TETOB|nr:hypothetical protein OEZ86_014022 [Tetradesmus obliquus]|eukprot:jgi/Sobl393_1/12963/SZX62970.1